MPWESTRERGAMAVGGRREGERGIQGAARAQGSRREREREAGRERCQEDARRARAEEEDELERWKISTLTAAEKNLGTRGGGRIGTAEEKIREDIFISFFYFLSFTKASAKIPWI
jgi:hypothetical protein